MYVWEREKYVWSVGYVCNRDVGLCVCVSHVLAPHDWQSTAVCLQPSSKCSMEAPSSRKSRRFQVKFRLVCFAYIYHDGLEKEIWVAIYKSAKLVRSSGGELKERALPKHLRWQVTKTNDRLHDKHKLKCQGIQSIWHEDSTRENRYINELTARIVLSLSLTFTVKKKLQWVQLALSSFSLTHTPGQ